MNNNKCYICKKEADITSDKGPLCLSCFASLAPEEPKKTAKTAEERKEELAPAPKKENTGLCSICKKKLDPNVCIESDTGFVCMDCFTADAQEENEKGYNPLTNFKHLNFLMFNLYHEDAAESKPDEQSFLSARYINVSKEDPTKSQVLEISSNQTVLPTTVPEFFSSVVPLSEYQFLITGGCVNSPGGYIPASSFLGVAIQKHNYYFSFGPLTNMSQSRFAHSSIIVDNYLYVIGGMQRNAKDNTYCWLSSCEKFNLKGLKMTLDIVLETGDKSELPTHSWENVEKLNNPRANLSVFEAEGKIYAFGGFSGANVLEQSIEKFDPVKNKWEVLNFKDKLQKINYNFLASSLVLNIDHQIFILGGTDGNKASDKVVRIDTKTMELENLKSLNKPRAGAHGFALIKTLYLFGGETPSKAGAPLIFEVMDLDKKNEGFKSYQTPDEVNKDSGILGSGFVGDYGFFISSYKF